MQEHRKFHFSRQGIATLVALSLLLMSAACAKQRPTGLDPVADPSAAGSGGGRSLASPATTDEMQGLYRSMGLIAGTPALPFVATMSFLHGWSADTTLVLLSLSMPSAALSFEREGEHYLARYRARVELWRGQQTVQTIEAAESVLVPTFRETSRVDESIIWQRYLSLAPGRYSLTLAVEDEGHNRGSSQDVTLDVPRLDPASLATPVLVYEAIPRETADSLPRILARPRSTLIFGQDTIVPLYIDAVGTSGPSRIDVRVLSQDSLVEWAEPFDLPVRNSTRSTVVTLPVARMGIGLNAVQVSIPGSADTARTRVLVSLGEDLPIATFDEMVSYLRYFTTADRLKELRDAPPARRAEAWATFLAETDPVPGTPEHEGLRDYFGRIRTANVRFRDDAQVGWQSDRGIAFVALGDPDNIVDTGLINPGARVRQQIWEYRELRVQLIFVDQTGFGRWRLTSQGRADLDNAFRRKLAERIQ